MMKYSTYLFDFDYTLADSSVGIVLCFKHVLKEWNIDNITDVTIKRTIGKTLTSSFEELTGITDPNQLALMVKAYSEKADILMNAHTILFPETHRVLTTLKEKGARIGIVSTKYRFRIANYLKDFFSEDFFDIIIGGEDVTLHKPSPQGIMLASQQLEVPPHALLYIGDSVVDAQAAQAGGVDFAGVLTGMTTAEELRQYPCRAILTTLDDLLNTTLSISTINP